MLKAECGGSDDHTSHKQRASPLYPGVGHRSRPSPSSSTQPLCLPSQGTKRPSKNATCQFPEGPPSPKFRHRSLFILNKAVTNSWILLEACYHLMYQFNPWAAEGDLFWKLLTPLGGVNRHFGLFLLLIFTSKPKTKDQVATGLFKDVNSRRNHRQVSSPCESVLDLLKLERKAGILPAILS